MSGAASRALALAAVAVLAALTARPGSAGALLAAAPLVAVLLAGLLRLRYWSIATAIVALPYFCYGVMEILTSAGRRGAAVGFSVLTIVAFLASLDALRRR